jgi:peptide/nickel transport system permease protein
VAYYIVLFPGAFLSVTVLAMNLLGDGLRDALDPRLARRM